MDIHDTVTGEDRSRTDPVDALARLDELLHADEASVVVFGLDGSLIELNQVARAGLGVESPADLLDGTPVRDLLRALLDQVPQQLLADPDGGTWRGDIDVVVPVLGARVFATTVLVRHVPALATGGYVAAIARDVTDDHAARDQLARRMGHDEVTGLINRAAALAETARALDELGATTGDVGILMIDVDLLRDVNDALGHEVGDRLLAATARRLATAVRPTDVVARVGGDEFMVLCRELPDATVAMELADRVRRALTGRLQIKDLELDVSVSVGVALSAGIDAPASDRAAIELLGHADTAVHAAKRAGRARAVLYTDELRSRARGRTELAAALGRALRGDQLAIEYQPIYSAVSEQVEGVEALLRWDHPGRGRIDAGEFIGIAEDTGVIGAIGDWVLSQACTDARAWIDRDLTGQRFAIHVNVSRLQLSDPGFVNRVVEHLREHRLRPRQLVLEARETTLIGDSSEVTRSVRALRRVGVRVALDNFGTGANALSILTDIGADLLKLDGGLALPSGASDADTRVVRALVLLAHALNMEVVAERVSSVEQLRRLRAAGCDLVQGHLFGTPCAADQVPLFLTS
jgi:diguanylate cyclase (GGDEF)-like protein